ncbi:MAG: FkbM family methyltransferase, partial [Chloroflexota bacterium]
LKIDVEGGELAVIRGALGTLARSKGFVVVFEAHPKQVSRTGIDPMSVISLIRSVRLCSARVTEQPDADVSLEKPFFDQFAPTRVYNVCVSSD